MIFVVTNPESGWDCVRGVYEADSKEDVEEAILNEEGLEEKPEYWEDTHCIHQVGKIQKIYKYKG